MNTLIDTRFSLGKSADVFMCQDVFMNTAAKNRIGRKSARQQALFPSCFWCRCQFIYL